MGRPANDPIYAFPRSIYDLVETFASPEEAAEIYRAVLRFYFEGVEIVPEEIGDERTACLVRSFLGRVACARRSALAKSGARKATRIEGEVEQDDVASQACSSKTGRGEGAVLEGDGDKSSCVRREVRTEKEEDSYTSNTPTSGLPSEREVEKAIRECSDKLGIPVGDAGREAAGFLAYNKARGWRLSGGILADDWRPLAAKWVLATRAARTMPGVTEGSTGKERAGDGEFICDKGGFRKLAAESPSMRREFGLYGRL